MTEKMTILHDERGKPAFAVLPWAEYQRLVTPRSAAGAQAKAGDAAAFRRALAARPVGGDAVDLGLAEAGARAKSREAQARRRAAKRTSKTVAFVPAEIVAATIGGMTPLKAWREHSRLTQQQLADRARLSRAYLAQLESGARVGTVDVLAKLAAAMGCLVDDLIEGNTESGRSAVRER
ncbi:MAG TPA: helix-turn-helix transcriptional regulator [Candidatus Angelobacter sp.]|nr:helix-turn-helix transcriptional regulator [Candidatus Angelobacter sp.]